MLNWAEVMSAQFTNANRFCFDFVLSDLTFCEVLNLDLSLVNIDAHQPCLEITLKVIQAFVHSLNSNTIPTFNFKRADTYNLYFFLRDISSMKFKTLLQQLTYSIKICILFSMSGYRDLFCQSNSVIHSLIKTL